MNRLAAIVFLAQKNRTRAACENQFVERVVSVTFDVVR
jgi:hypothetical protein